MVFSSTVFLFLFLPTLLLLYISCKRMYSKNIILLCASLFFYTWGETSYVIVMLTSIIINYYIALIISANKRENIRKLTLVIGIALNLAILAHFKYSNFLIANLNHILQNLNIAYQIILDKPIHLPIGISFFTFWEKKTFQKPWSVAQIEFLMFNILWVPGRKNSSFFSTPSTSR